MPDEEEQTLNEPQDTSEPVDEGVAEETPQHTAPEEALDPNLYDEDGVPWKNRAKEYERKYSESMHKAQAYEQAMRVQQPQPKEQETIDPYDEILNATDQKQAIKKLEERIVSQFKKEMFENEKRTSSQRAFAKHKDLYDPNSELYKAVDEEMRHLQSMGFNPQSSPTALENIADKVASRMAGNNSRQKPNIEQPTNLPRIGTTPSTMATKTRRSDELPEINPSMKNALNSVRFMSAEDKKRVEQRIRERQGKGEFEITGEGSPRSM